MTTKLLPILLSLSLPALAQTSNLRTRSTLAAQQIEQKVIAWRHDLHEQPELGNSEVRTAGIIAQHL